MYRIARQLAIIMHDDRNGVNNMVDLSNLMKYYRLLRKPYPSVFTVT